MMTPGGTPIVLRGGLAAAPRQGATDATSTRPMITQQVYLQNGKIGTLVRVFSATPVAQSQTDATVIAAPPSDQFFILLLFYELGCDAATLVSLKSKGAGSSTTIISPKPIAANSARATRSAHGLAKCLPGEALVMTTGAGGNTYYDFEYVLVPIDADIN